MIEGQKEKEEMKEEKNEDYKMEEDEGVGR